MFVKAKQDNKYVPQGDETTKALPNALAEMFGYKAWHCLIDHWLAEQRPISKMQYTC